MALIRCELCGTEQPDGSFAEHLDGHSDSEWKRWPGGLRALAMVLDQDGGDP